MKKFYYKFPKGEDKKDNVILSKTQSIYAPNRKLAKLYIRALYPFKNFMIVNRKDNSNDFRFRNAFAKSIGSKRPKWLNNL
jgi:hypothetical protein